MTAADTPDDEPSRPLGSYDSSLGWAMEADMVSQMNSAAKHAQAIADAKLEQQPPAPPPPEPQEAQATAPAEGVDPLDGKLGWAMEYIDNSRAMEQPLDQGPTAAPQQEQRPEQYDELNSLAWALAAEEVTQPDRTPDLGPSIG